MDLKDIYPNNAAEIRAKKKAEQEAPVEKSEPSEEKEKPKHKSKK
jgi:hypothetical protein